MTEQKKSKLQQAIFDYSEGNIGLIEIMSLVNRIENDNEIKDIALELICKYQREKRNGHPSHYLEDDINYWIKQAQEEQTNRICAEQNNEKTI